MEQIVESPKMSTAVLSWTQEDKWGHGLPHEALRKIIQYAVDYSGRCPSSIANLEGVNTFWRAVAKEGRFNITVDVNSPVFRHQTTMKMRWLICNRFDFVTTLDIGSWKIRDSDLRLLLCYCEELQWLKLKHTQMTDRSLKMLANFPKLHTLLLDDVSNKQEDFVYDYSFVADTGESDSPSREDLLIESFEHPRYIQQPYIPPMIAAVLFLGPLKPTLPPPYHPASVGYFVKRMEKQLRNLKITVRNQGPPVRSQGHLNLPTDITFQSTCPRLEARPFYLSEDPDLHALRSVSEEDIEEEVEPQESASPALKYLRVRFNEHTNDHISAHATKLAGLLTLKENLHLEVVASRFYSTDFLQQLSCPNITSLNIHIVCKTRDIPAQYNAITTIITKWHHSLEELQLWFVGDDGKCIPQYMDSGFQQLLYTQPRRLRTLILYEQITKETLMYIDAISSLCNLWVLPSKVVECRIRDTKQMNHESRSRNIFSQWDALCPELHRKWIQYQTLHRVAVNAQRDSVWPLICAEDKKTEDKEAKDKKTEDKESEDKETEDMETDDKDIEDKGTKGAKKLRGKRAPKTKKKKR